MKLFSKTLIYFLILYMTGNNTVGDLIKNGNQDYNHNFKVLYASHFPLNVKKDRFLLLWIDGCERLGSNESGLKVCLGSNGFFIWRNVFFLMDPNFYTFLFRFLEIDVQKWQINYKANIATMQLQRNIFLLYLPLTQK